MDNVVIVPMRSGSKGLKDKNIKDFSGLPLYFWTIKKLYHLYKQEIITRVIISSDSDWYLDLVRLSFNSLFNIGDFILSKRPEELATDDTSTEDVCLYILYKYDIVDGNLGIIEVTSPLIPIDSLGLMLSSVNDNIYSSFLVCADISQYWKCNKDNNYRWEKLYTDRKMRQEETEILYKEIGAWSIKVDKFLQYKNRIIENSCIPIIIDKKYGLSINDLQDFYYAEILMKENSAQIYKNCGLYK